MIHSTISPFYRTVPRTVLPLATARGVREVDGWYLIVSSLVRGYTG
ncbi:MAG: hypothetical protein HYZ13_14680 [Acidobacteria bacterium]|nr:hypothetical protein [Acidobacteriota bacterium]